MDINKIIQTNAEKFHPKISKYITIEDFIALIKAIIKRESNWNSKDVMEEKNVNDFSIGYMQVRIETAKWMLSMYNKSNDELYKMLFEPNLNIYVGSKYLAYQIERYKGNFKLAIASYNSGTALTKSGKYIKTNEEIEKYNNEPLINENYVNDVLKYWKQYKSEKKTELMSTSIIFGIILGITAIYLYNKIGG